MRININRLLLFICGLQYIAYVAAQASQTRNLRGQDQLAAKQQALAITSGDINAMLEILNYARLTTKVSASSMPYVTYNATVATRLEAYRDSVGPNWFFAPYTGNLKYRIESGPYNGMHLMALPEFKDLAHDGWSMGWHDTGQNAASGKGSMPYNFHFRFSQQAHCFDYAACDNEHFNNFMTCNSTMVTLNGGTPCSWFFQYYCRGVMDQLTEISCVRLGIVGPNAPKGQPDSFFCYARYLSKALPAPINDVPFAEGPRAASCPEGFVAQELQVRKKHYPVCMYHA